MYVRYRIDVNKRNFTLLAVPSMYPVALGDREYFGESFCTFKLFDETVCKFDILQRKSTIPHRDDVVSLMRNLVVPNVYGETIYGGYILSPCNVVNKRLYRYYVTPLTDNRIEVTFIPKVKNTQLVNGKAIVDRDSGRIILIEYSGEVDMIDFHTRITMSEDRTLIPASSETDIKFKFVWNDITASYKTFYGLDSQYTENADKINADTLFDKIRPIPLDEEQIKIYRENAIEDRQTGKKKNRILSKWGNYFLNRTAGNFGARSQGSYRVSPIINPQYVGYSSTKGVTYRIKLNGSYSFSKSSGLDITADFGYSFKQNQLYISVPLKFTLGKTFRVETEFGTGNHIANSDVLNKIKDEKIDSIQWDKMNLSYFKDMYWKLTANVDLGRHLSVRPGLIFHRRMAVDKEGFRLSGEPDEYRSFAPTLQLQYYPSFFRGSVVTLDYERGVKGVFKSDMVYERIETDFAWKRKLHGMKVLSMRTGGGFYTSRSQNSYFLDYSNFRYEYVPGGWNDDWTGDFQVLNSNWYNASKYYVRSNLTYESPMLIAYRLPLVGKYLETERIYANLLYTQYLRPYVECGYGFTNRYFSAGIFCGFTKRKFEGVGIRFDVELFKDW